ncbi:aspartate--ammonia ligase [Kangiella geojedonensis]|uniref:Aspartate--ammonia ligase n=1 Tax=Kangiella geojedonensis TaxID=914150 RepID=A0A0F6RCV5_9GAMM|nr:aspartate--ammonia ligase [Kangiella geojedonensis]AKE52763.1 Aspartate/ammonia ligase [Kangiella geojedonensis]
MKKLPKEAFIQDQRLIQRTKSFFMERLSQELSLLEVQAPILTYQGDGIQDDLNGVEKPVSVQSQTLDKPLEIVQSLAKWKRQLLARSDFDIESGIVTQMRAIRPDEERLSERHSLYVDQWDWEKVICDSSRSLDYLQETVQRIYKTMQETDHVVANATLREPLLPQEITFIQTEDLLKQYPDLNPSQREYEACKKHGVIFLIGIGGELSDGSIHDGRAPDYDDWSTPTDDGYYGLNGDILVWNPVLEDAFELSSMGIRVSPQVMQQQLQIRGCEHRLNYLWHQQLMAGHLPQTIGGGIGQSRLIMFLLQKEHIGQVQFSVWPDELEITVL